MADDLSLLFRIRGDAAGAKAAASETRAAIASLRGTSSAEFKAIENAGKAAFQGIGNQALQRIPVIGNALSGLTQEFQSLAGAGGEAGASIGAMAGPIGIAVVGVTAMAAAGAVLVKTLVDLSVSTAEWQGALLDLSQQTGVSVETLSGLEVVAKTTGSSLEQLAASLGIFQKNLEEASQDAESKAGQAFKKLGVTVTDTEDSLRQTIKALAEMPEGFAQTSAALEVFGRGGKAFLAIAKESNGDLDGMIARLRDLGVVVSTDTAKAADELNDQLAVVNFQIRALTAQLVSSTIPQIRDGLTQISQVLKDNKAGIDLLGQAIGILVASPLSGFLKSNIELLNQMGEGLNFLTSRKWTIEYQWVNIGGAIPGLPGLTLSGSENVATTTGRLASGGAEGENMFGGLGGSVLPSEAKSGGGRGAAAKKVSEGQRLLNSLIDEYNRVLAKKNDLDKLDIVNNELLLEKYKNIDPKLKSRIIAYGLMIKGEEDEEKAQKKNIETNKEYLAIIKTIRDEMNRTTAERVSLEEQIAQAVQDQRAALSELQGFEKTHLQTVEEYIAQAVKQAEAVGGVTDKMKEYFALLIQIAAKEDEITANKKRFEGVEGGAEGSGPIRQTGSAIDQLFKAAHDNLSGGKQSAALAGLEALTAGFDGLGQAIGQVVQAWVLYGSAGQSVRQVTAQILAGVAQQAAVKAVFELAEGFATLALSLLGMPTAAGAAAAHFQAAAIYGVVAGVTALAGRAVAGGSFANSRGGGSSGGGGGGSTGGTSRTERSSGPITMGSQRGPDVLHLQVSHSFKNDGTLHSYVESAMVKSAVGNGAVRQVIVKEVKRQE